MTATAALPLPTRPLRISLPRTYASVLLPAVALAIRLPHFGDPAFKIDEQFYLLVGDRLLHGALPYVDIWDRKPIGLFLIYAFAALFGQGFVAYQLLATTCAIGTMLCIFAIGRRVASDTAAILSSILYLLWLEVAEGGGGQAQVFYGLPVAAAAVLLLQPEDHFARSRSFAAMGLIGIAIQIKYTVLFEGAYFGLVVAYRALRRDAARASIEIILLATTALAPTLLALGAYAAMAHLHDFWFANFTSIFLRGETPAADSRSHVATVALWLLPFMLCLAVSLWTLWRDPAARRWQLFMIGWCGAACVGVASLGLLYAHYLLPLFIPLTAAVAPAFRRRPLGLVLATFCAWIPISQIDWHGRAATLHSQRQMAALGALIPATVAQGCMQMFDGPPILYHLTNACTVSRFIFPDHLSAAIEAHAIGIDPQREVRRILAVRPEIITISDVYTRPPNPATFALMRAGLAAHYRLVGQSWVDERNIQVFRRRIE
ncbi:hypothetical protein FHS31_000021 [Sphingomonas vulcanisoli]|uniref:Glycosyltransferase RgtA/B/C/D-like domain-containing protein n=1 Tax=Sphingomonas vulcanisoli TaxID=1658060 RepID=A0ABX0TQM0_9SPHN|nr:hypothetical protein [Sphingomonas vulcanisoli]NIJ06439.1 hypothetical protein [Sphingomonas vulcanisoli]